MKFQLYFPQYLFRIAFTFMLTLATLGGTACSLSAQGFVLPAVPWPVPNGGIAGSPAPPGFWFTSNSQGALTSGSHTWNTLDINGDSLTDLIVTGEIDSFHQVLGGPANPHWRVHLGTGTEFLDAGVTWAVPSGGRVSSTGEDGFNHTEFEQDGSAGSESWVTRDMNGDGRPDIVVTAMRSDTSNTSYGSVFSPDTNPHWKVYLNTGSGFASSAIHWALPFGGRNILGFDCGFYRVQHWTGLPYETQTQNWVLMDLDGDLRDDLVVTAAVDSMAQQVRPFGGSQPYWKVYHNNGTGFDTAAISWLLPPGGSVDGPPHGFYWIKESVQADEIIGDQQWDLLDMNHDHLPDLVITAEADTHTSGYVEVIVFDVGTNPHWKVHYNTGAAFDPVGLPWTLPAGGELSGGNMLGFTATSFDKAHLRPVGCPNWELVDIDGDQYLDLVVTALHESFFGVRSFSPDNFPSWQVYRNIGTGFSNTVHHWPIPYGGIKHYLGYWMGFPTTQYDILAGEGVGTVSWKVMDMNGDLRPDFVLTSALTADGKLVFGSGVDPYWKVFWNTGAPVETPEKEIMPPMVLYPNPATSTLFLDPQGEHGTFNLYDLSGKWILSQVALGGEVSIAVEECTRGIYIGEWSGKRGSHSVWKVVLR
jgi:hypothetical protein